MFSLNLFNKDNSFIEIQIRKRITNIVMEVS